jgi:hypothetical protein
MTADSTERAATGAGLITFAAIMLALGGAFNILDGITALSKESFFAPEAAYLFSNLHTWGWIILFLGVLQLIAGFLLFGGSELARWFGISVAGVNAIGQLAFVNSYPLWAMSMFVLDIVVIYALARYAGARLRQA